VELAAEKGFMPLFAWTSPARSIASMMDTYLNTPNPDNPPTRRRVKISRLIYVADSVDEAKRDLGGADLGPVHRARRLDGFIPVGGTRDDVSVDYLIDCGAFFCGPPDRVCRQINDFYSEVGGFGVLLLLAGKDWGTNEQRARSMQRFMLEVAPRLSGLTSP
jgi:alkanesulfonate monooxygenase SsuD/methylene tetrahydromethanopterin reductase-like flavin-dependent oxidoreductase (luciferase family)